MNTFSQYSFRLTSTVLLMMITTFSGCASIETSSPVGSWQLAKANISQQIIDQTTLKGVSFSIRFDDTGRAQGQTACNRWSSTYQQEGSMLKLGPVAMTKMRCVHKNDQQKIVNKHFPRALSELAKAYIDGDKLTLSWPNGDEWELYRTPR